MHGLFSRSLHSLMIGEEVHSILSCNQSGCVPERTVMLIGRPCCRAVIMHRDIVPRAFACDYSLVADLLARVGDGFREHGCLQNPHGRQVALPPGAAACCTCMHACVVSWSSL